MAASHLQIPAKIWVNPPPYRFHMIHFTSESACNVIPESGKLTAVM